MGLHEPAPKETVEKLMNGHDNPEVRKIIDSMLAPPVPLDVELVPYFFTEPLPHLQHPLVENIFHTDRENARVNENLRLKKQMIKEYEAEGNYAAIIHCCVIKPYRIEYLLKYRDKMGEAKYWPLLRDVWSMVENLWQYKLLLPILFRGRTGPIREMFDPEDWVAFDDMPDQITIHRGCGHRNRNGWSWTTDRHKAKWFATRLCEKRPLLLTATIPKTYAHCYLHAGGRGEHEVIVNPKLISGIKRVAIKP